MKKINIAKASLPYLAYMVFSLFGAFILALSFYAKLWFFEVLVSQSLLLTLLVAISFLLGTLMLMRQKVNSVIDRRIKIVYKLKVAVVFGVIIINLLNAAPITLQPAASSDNILTFGTYNRLVTNASNQAAIDYLKSNPIDILVLQEVTQEDMRQLQEELNYSSAALARPGAGPASSSNGILTNLPVVNSETIELSGNMTVLKSTLLAPGLEQNLIVYSVHILPPLGAGLYNDGNQALADLAAEIQSTNGPVIVAGDFNRTVYSPVLEDFRDGVSAKLEMINSSQVPSCSWFGSRLKLPLCMKIDHIFVSDNFSARDSLVSSDLGSDHRLISSEIVY